MDIQLGWLILHLVRKWSLHKLPPRKAVEKTEAFKVRLHGDEYPKPTLAQVQRTHTLSRGPDLRQLAHHALAANVKNADCDTRSRTTYPRGCFWPPSFERIASDAQRLLLNRGSGQAQIDEFYDETERAVYM